MAEKDENAQVPEQPESGSEGGGTTTGGTPDPSPESAAASQAIQAADSLQAAAKPRLAGTATPDEILQAYKTGEIPPGIIFGIPDKPTTAQPETPEPTESEKLEQQKIKDADDALDPVFEGVSGMIQREFNAMHTEGKARTEEIFKKQLETNPDFQWRDPQGRCLTEDAFIISGANLFALAGISEYTDVQIPKGDAIRDIDPDPTGKLELRNPTALITVDSLIDMVKSVPEVDDRHVDRTQRDYLVAHLCRVLSQVMATANAYENTAMVLRSATSPPDIKLDIFKYFVPIYQNARMCEQFINRLQNELRINVANYDLSTMGVLDSMEQIEEIIEEHPELPILEVAQQKIKRHNRMSGSDLIAKTRQVLDNPIAGAIQEEMKKQILAQPPIEA